jgi:RND superfamily putative drug exporter
VLLAVAILTDALIVRMTLVPSLLTLLGERSWYIPRWLDRLLPDITIEPPHERDEPLPHETDPADAAGTVGAPGPA